MRMKMIAVLFVALGLLGAATVAEAGCWACGGDQCCKAATTGTQGMSTCINNQVCLASCICYFCNRYGSLCSGSAPAECDNIFNACEEHQSLRAVPNGEAIDPAMLLRPPAVEPALVIAPHGAQACKAV